MQDEIRVISSSYITDSGHPVIEMFGRNRNGESFTLLYKGFAPYFFVMEPTEDEIWRIKSSGLVTSVEEKELWYIGKMRRAVKFTCKTPMDVPQLRDTIQEKERVMAADIPFHFRFFYDLDLGSCVGFEGDEVKDERFSTDHIVLVNSVRKVDDFLPPIKVLSFDIENGIKDQRLYVIGYTTSFKGKYGEGSISGEPKDILEKFLKTIREEDPDIITGYNIDGYDLPFLQKLAEKESIKMRLGRDTGTIQRVQERFWRVHGRVIADAWWSVKREIHPKQETLAYVSQQLLGETKLDVNRLNIEEEWIKDKDEVTKYCIKDAELAMKILEKIDIIEKYENMSSVAMIPLDDSWNSGVSTLIDSLMIREADRRGIAVPMNKFGGEEREKIEGGFVHTIEPGLYDMVTVMDFKSMYPSLMIRYNICFTTLSPSGENRSPTGARFLSSTVKKGLIPELLEKLMNTRDHYKELLKDEKDADRKRYLNSMQAQVKILMNSFYGVFASSFYRFTDPSIGASITAWARDTVKGINADLEQRGVQVVYGDTDSIFIKTGKTTVDEAVSEGNALKDEVYRKIGTIIEVEKVFDPMFSHGAKKRYVGKIVYPEKDKGTIVVRGYETRRTDSFPLQSDALMEIFGLVLDRNVDDALTRAEEIIADVRAGNVDLEKLVISRSVKEFSTYKDMDTIAGVQAAKKLMAMGGEFVPGMKVSWIVVDSKKTPQVVEPYVPDRTFVFRPDYEYYAERVAQTLSRVTEVFKVAEKKTEPVKITLDNYF
jgi:DNA polymerase I